MLRRNIVDYIHITLYLLLIIELYVICHLGGYDLGFIQFFMDFSEKKIVLIYYTNGGVRYWIHSNYLAFLKKNQKWFVYNESLVSGSVSPMGYLYGCFSNLGLRIHLFLSIYLSLTVVQFLHQYIPIIHTRNLKIITNLIQQVQGTIDIFFMQIYYKMYSECNWNKKKKKIKMKKKINLYFNK